MVDVWIAIGTGNGTASVYQNGDYISLVSEVTGQKLFNFNVNDLLTVYTTPGGGYSYDKTCLYRYAGGLLVENYCFNYPNFDFTIPDYWLNSYQFIIDFVIPKYLCESDGATIHCVRDDVNGYTTDPNCNGDCDDTLTPKYSCNGTNNCIRNDTCSGSNCYPNDSTCGGTNCATPPPKYICDVVNGVNTCIQDPSGNLDNCDLCTPTTNNWGCNGTQCQQGYGSYPAGCDNTCGGGGGTHLECNTTTKKCESKDGSGDNKNGCKNVGDACGSNVVIIAVAGLFMFMFMMMSMNN